jgi:hypothetical protein
VPTQWPTNAWQRDAAEKAIEQFLGPYRDRILDPVFSLSASKLMLQRRLPATLPTPLANGCRAIAHQVLDLLQIPLAETHEATGLDTSQQLPPTESRFSNPANLGTSGNAGLSRMT